MAAQYCTVYTECTHHCTKPHVVSWAYQFPQAIRSYRLTYTLCMADSKYTLTPTTRPTHGQSLPHLVSPRNNLYAVL